MKSDTKRLRKEIKELLFKNAEYVSISDIYVTTIDDKLISEILKLIRKRERKERFNTRWKIESSGSL